jgi:hypothetical protein
MAKKDNNGYIGNPTLGLNTAGIISRNKNFETRYYTQFDAYSNDTNLISSPQYVDSRPILTQSIQTGGGNSATATASLSNGSIASMILYNGGSGYGGNSLITMSFSGGGGVDAGAFVSSVSAGAIFQITPFYSVQDVIIADAGGPYTTAPTLSFSAPGTSLGWRPAVTAVASASITNGKLTGFTIHKSGSNYTTTSWPTITVSGGGLAPGGTQAVLVPVLRNGTGYTSTPTLTITSPTGTGAVVSASLIAGIQSISVTNGGTDYITPPTVQIQGAAITYTSASATLIGDSVSTISVTSGSSKFAAAPTINISGGLPPLPEIANNQIAAWYGVYENNSNWIGLTIATNGGGGYTINWGDGTSNSYTSAATASKQYDTTSYAALTSSIYSATDLYKPVLITITLSGSATSLNTVDFTTRPTPPTGLLPSNSPSNWKSIKMAGDQVTRIIVGAVNPTKLQPSTLERFEYSGSNKIQTWTATFSTCANLVEIPSLYMASGSNFSSCFAGCYNLQKLPALDMSNATTITSMFSTCYNLRSITLLNSEKINTWTTAFTNCFQLRSIDATFSSASVNYQGTFVNCNNLLSLPPLDISNNTTFNTTFANCYNIKQIKFIGTTAKATSFIQTFNNNLSLESIPLTLDLSACTNASFMFANCSALQTLPILTNTRNLANASSMFSGCRRLRTIPWFDTINVTNASGMFGQCMSLTSVPQLNYARVTDFNAMFNGCNNLISVPPMETSNGTNFSSMFSGLTVKEIPWINTSKGTNFSFMFNGCASLLKIPELDLGEATNTSFMFSSCQSLTTIPFFNLSKSTTVNSMFSSCNALQSVPYLDLSAATDINSIFSGCGSLKNIGILNTSRATNFSSLFNSCVSLNSIPVIDTSRGLFFSNTFNACGLTEIPALNLSAGTNLNSIFSQFSNVMNLKRIRAYGMNASFDISNHNLDSIALNEVYTNVSATGAGKTITVTGNWGTANDNPAIATAKGWAVTG